MSKRTTDNFLLPFLFFIALSLLFFGLSWFKVDFIIRYPLESILIPPQKTFYSMKLQVKENIRILFTSDLKQKIIQSDEYKRALDVLKQKNQLLEEENNSMRRQLETNLPASWDFIPAQVMGRERYLLIDKGTKDGVKQGMVVIAQNILVGKVGSVSQKNSSIILLWDPDLKIPAKTNKNVKGLLAGAFGNRVILGRILQKEPLNSLDLVSTSGEEGIPSDLLIGKVDTVTAKKEDIYKEGTVSLLLDYDKLERVFVVSSY